MPEEIFDYSTVEPDEVFDSSTAEESPEGFDILKDALKNSSIFGKIASALEESGKNLYKLLEAPKQFLDEGMSQISKGNALAGGINIINSIGALGGSALGVLDNFVKELPGGQTVSDVVNFTFSLPNQGAIGLTKTMESLGYPSVEKEKAILSTGGSILSGHKLSPNQVGEAIDAFKNTVDISNQYLLGALMGGGIKKTIPKEVGPIKLSEKRINEIRRENAIQEPKTKGVDVGEQPRISEEMGKTYTEEKVTKASEENVNKLSSIEKDALDTALMRQVELGKITTQERFDILEGKIPYPTEKFGKFGQMDKMISGQIHQEIKWYKESVQQTFDRLREKKDATQEIDKQLEGLSPIEQLTKLKEVYWKLRDTGAVIAAEIAPKRTAPKKPTPLSESKGIKSAEELIRDNQIRIKTKGFDETKTRGLALSTEAKAVESGLVESIKDLPDYQVLKNDPQIKTASDIIANDLPRAKRIALGQEVPPEGLLPGFVHKGLENYAIKNNDVALIKELATSPYLSEQATTAGQFIQSLRGQDPFSPVKAVKEVIKVREESPKGKRNAIIEKGYEDKIKTLEQKISEQEKRLTNIEINRTYKNIQREESAKIRREKREVSKEALDKEFNDIMGEFVKSYKPNIGIDPVQVKILMKAVRNKAQKGITDVAQVIDDIYLALADKIDGLTKRNIQDAISGYGKATFKTRDELQKSVADLKKQAEIISKIEDLEGGQSPIKRQVTKTTPSNELQSLKDELKTKMAESEVVAQESLVKTKEIIKNKIKELENKIAQGNYKKPNAKEKLTDLEKANLEKELGDLRNRYKDVQKFLGDKITDKEVETINDLSQKITNFKNKIDAGEKSKFGEPLTKAEQDYGHTVALYGEYIDHLKLEANKMTWSEFKKSALGEQLQTLLSGTGKLPGLSKSLKATFDNSGLFNQNILTLFTHPAIWSKNALKSFRDIAGVIGGKNMMREINANKFARENWRNGLYRHLKLAIGTVEEAFPESAALRKIPVFGKIHTAAETAFTGLAYRNRMDVADLLIEHAKNLKIDPFSKEFNGTGKVINSLTGRASLGKFEGGADIVNVVMFAPRFLKSHIDVLTAHIMSKDMSRFARIEALKNWFKIVGGMSATTVAINALRPGTIETDPHSTDFAKVRIGDTRFNYTGGLGQIIVFATRTLPLLVGQQGYTKNSKGELVELNSGKFGARTGWDVLTEFMRGKASPFFGAVIDRLDGKTIIGEKTTIGNQIGNLTIPLPIENYIELQENPKSANKFIATVADMMGIFASTYSDDENLRKFKNALLTADKEVFGIKKKENLHRALNSALFRGVITEQQYNDYKQQLKDLQKEALNNRSK